MKTDRELLEAAAKAAGLALLNWMPGSLGFATIPNVRADGRWNPLADDGDALRLAVKMGISVIHHACSVTARAPKDVSIQACRIEFEEGKRLETTRRAIVKAAAVGDV